MYYILTMPNEIKNVVDSLESMGFEKSRFSADIEETKAVATFITSNEREYIFLNEIMLSPREPYSWTNQREKVNSLNELVDKAGKYIKEAESRAL